MPLDRGWEPALGEAAEVTLHFRPDDEDDLAEPGTPGIEQRVFQERGTARADAGKLLEAAESAAQAGSENHEDGCGRAMRHYWKCNRAVTLSA